MPLTVSGHDNLERVLKTAETFHVTTSARNDISVPSFYAKKNSFRTRIISLHQTKQVSVNKVVCWRPNDRHRISLKVNQDSS